jgi:hypothetical protein
MERNVKLKLTGSVLLLIASLMLPGMAIAKIGLIFASIVCMCTCDKLNKKLTIAGMIVLVVLAVVDLGFSFIPNYLPYYLRF